jgi:D-amino-acid oxidase
LRTHTHFVCFDAVVSASSNQPDAIVIGAGVIGLVTAWRLQAQGLAVEVWTRDEPEQTTSAVAAAIWYPFLAEPRERVAAWSAFTFQRLRELAGDSDTGVHMQSVVEVFDHDEPDLWWASDVPGLVRLTNEELPVGYRAGVRVDVPVCEVPVHMPWLLRGLRQHGVRFVQREVSSLEQPLAAANIVVNCTGLGARELCRDNELQAVRGQVLRIKGSHMPHAWIDDTRDGPCYVIPRADGLVVGGTAQMGDERLAVDDGDSEAILERVTRAFPQLRGAQVLATRVGLRPYRSTVRLECEQRSDGRRLIHNYGHGGSGYTLAWGCAEDVALLLTS